MSEKAREWARANQTNGVAELKWYDEPKVAFRCECDTHVLLTVTKPITCTCGRTYRIRALFEVAQ